MKTRFLLIIAIGILPTISTSFASCIVNDDWPEAPCLDTIGNGWYDQDEVDKWTNYYSYKGSIFMEAKYLELRDAIKEDRVEEWAEESIVNRNVYEYYFFSGRAPNTGEYHDRFHIIPINEGSAFAYSGEDLIYGSSSFERVPISITPGKPSHFEIKFQYTSGPYALTNFSPVFDVSPSSVSSMIHIDVEPFEGISQGQVVRIPVSITADPDIEHEKIFLSVYFTGEHFSSRSNVFYKSAWTDSAIIGIKRVQTEDAPPLAELDSLEELTSPQVPYTDESLRLASEKKFVAEESMGGGSGIGYFDKSDFNQNTIIIPIIIGLGSALSLTYYFRKRK